MKVISSVCMTILLTLVIFGSIFNQAFAIQMEASISPSLNLAEAKFGGDKIISLTYPEASSISKFFNGKKDTISFTLNSSIQIMG